MEIEFIRTFLAAAETGSFAGAAARVNASASAVTERIKTLEYRLSARLFDRDKRGCTLTAAGQRFLEPARTIVQGWEEGRQDVSLPPKYTRSIAIGGQYGLWPGLLIDWLARARKGWPDLAIRAVAGTAERFNRDLAEGQIDLAFVYDPLFRKGVSTDLLFDDELVMVSSDPTQPWHENYARIKWGSAADGEIASRLGYFGGTGLQIDLGLLSADWLIAQDASGYMPRSMIGAHLADGRLSLVEGAPIVANPAYACWRTDYEQELIGDLITLVRSLAGK